jgi:hypothetical protein
MDAICDHMVNNDRPEPFSTLLAEAHAAGLEASPDGARWPTRFAQA